MRCNSVCEYAMFEYVARTSFRVFSRFARANGVLMSMKKLYVYEVLDEELDGEEFVVICWCLVMVLNSFFMVVDSSRGVR